MSCEAHFVCYVPVHCTMSCNAHFSQWVVTHISFAMNYNGQQFLLSIAFHSKRNVHHNSLWVIHEVWTLSFATATQLVGVVATTLMESLWQNIVSFIGLFCKRDIWFPTNCDLFIRETRTLSVCTLHHSSTQWVVMHHSSTQWAVMHHSSTS